MPAVIGHHQTIATRENNHITGGSDGTLTAAWQLPTARVFKTKICLVHLLFSSRLLFNAWSV
jgi:hypothetical protein